MNEQMPGDWQDLSKLWQGETIPVSSADIEAHLHRTRRQLWQVLLAQLAGLVVGIAAAAWLALLTPYRILGVALVVFNFALAMLMWRSQREPRPAGSPLLQSLKDFIASEDWSLNQLRLGRVLGFVALSPILMAVSAHLRLAPAISPSVLWAAGAATLYVVGALTWNLVLTRRARARRTRLEQLDRRLAS